MTCIVGLIDNGKIWMGGDSASTAGLSSGIIKDEKVFKIDDFLIGMTGYPRGAQLVRYKKWLPKYREDEHKSIKEFICTIFVDALMKLFKDNGYSRISNNEEETNDQYLIGFKGELFIIESNYQVMQYETKYLSIGCGAPYAKGSLFSMLGIKSLGENEEYTPGSLIEEALKAAEYFNAGVRGPFVIENI